MLDAKLPYRKLRRAGRIFRLALGKANEDRILLVASALAFVTALSIIPLLAAVAFVGDRIFSQFQQQILEALTEILPYTETTLVEQIRSFLDQARSLQGPALVALFVSAFLAFVTVEGTLNDIWQVSDRRSFRERLLSFTLLLFWGPILLGLSFSALPILPQFPGLVQRPVLIETLIIVASTLALTLLYWLVPYTRVNPRCALIGGITAGALLSLLRWGFSYYVELLHNANVIYSGFAILLFFLISINAAWTIALFGSVVAYTAQHRAALERGLYRGFPLEGRWAGLAALAALATGLKRGDPFFLPEELAEHLGVPPADLPRVLAPPVEEGWVKEVAGRQRGYLLATDPYRLPLGTIFEAYDRRSTAIFQPLGEPLTGRLEALTERLNREQREDLGDTTLAEISGLVPEGEGKVTPSGSSVE